MSRTSVTALLVIFSVGAILSIPLIKERPTSTEIGGEKISVPTPNEDTDPEYTGNVYRNERFGFEFVYPENSTLWENDYPEKNPRSGWSQAYLTLENGAAVEIYAEQVAPASTGIRFCHDDLCDREPIEKKTFQNISWDYLGSTTYCDVGECFTSRAVFRTSNGNGVVYVHAPSIESAEVVLSAFRFLPKQ